MKTLFPFYYPVVKNNTVSYEEYEKIEKKREKEIKTEIHQLLRIALTGELNGMQTYQILSLLGKQKSLERIEMLLES